MLIKASPVSPTTSSVQCNASNFFYSLHKIGLSYSPTGSHRSALSVILQFLGVCRIGEHVLVTLKLHPGRRLHTFHMLNVSHVGKTEGKVTFMKRSSYLTRWVKCGC